MVVENSQRAQDIKEELAKAPKFQWLKTENQGNIVEFKDVVESGGMLFVEFTDGSRINYDLMGEFVLKIDNDADVLDFSKEVAEKKNNMSATASVKKTAASSANPIHALLNKQKPNMVGIDISIQLNVPSHELHKIICESFDNSEDEIINYIVSGLSNDVIRQSVKEAIKNYYTTTDAK